ALQANRSAATAAAKRANGMSSPYPRSVDQARALLKPDQEGAYRFVGAVGIQVRMLGLRIAHEALRLARQREQLFAERDGHHAIAFAMLDQDRRCDLADAQVGAERVFYQPAHRQERIGGSPDIGRRGEGCVEHDTGHLALRRSASETPVPSDSPHSTMRRPG